MIKNLDREKLIQMFRKMLQIRCFEEKVGELFNSGLLSFATGFIHLYVGEEAVAVGVGSNLSPEDYITSTHRGHGHCIAKGAPLTKIMAEIFGKKTGCCKGKGGSMHIADVSQGILGTSGIVGAGIPLATGAGLSIKLRGTNQVCVSFFGDGASNTGAFHEGVNLAALWKLPVIFVCENNLYGITVSLSKSTSVRDIANRAIAYGIPGVIVDGMDILDVYQAAHEAIQRARKGEGPTLLECKTYRYRGHCEGEAWHQVYRSKEEVKEWLRKDPIEGFKFRLFEEGVLTEEEAKKIKEEVLQEVEEATRFALDSPLPEVEEALKDVYA